MIYNFKWYKNETKTIKNNYRFLSTPMSIRALAHEFVIGKTTASEIIHEICTAINNLFQIYLPVPTKETL